MNQNSNAWSHLPNAAHIDAIIESVARHTDIWIVAGYEARPVSGYADRSAAAYAAGYASRGAAMEAARGAAWGAASNPIMALVAYDDAAKYLSMTSDELRKWTELSEQPAAILMLSAVIAYEQINQLETE